MLYSLIGYLLHDFILSKRNSRVSKLASNGLKSETRLIIPIWAEKPSKGPLRAF
nr:MAG TPA: hypothetical protein [Caudoviricetes sp.]